MACYGLSDVCPGDSQDGFIRRLSIAKTTRLTTGTGIPTPSESRTTCLDRFIEYYRRNFTNNPDQSTHGLGNYPADGLSNDGIAHLYTLTTSNSTNFFSQVPSGFA